MYLVIGRLCLAKESQIRTKSHPLFFMNPFIHSFILTSDLDLDKFALVTYKAIAMDVVYIPNINISLVKRRLGSIAILETLQESESFYLRNCARTGNQ